MIVDTLLLLNSTVAMAMALALLPAIWSRAGDFRGARYWAWGCVAIGWSWLARGWGAGLPLDSATMLTDGLRVLGITLLASGCRGAHEHIPLNPLWPIGLLVTGHIAAALFPAFWPLRGLYVAIILAWVAGRTGIYLLRVPSPIGRPTGIGFLLFGLLALAIAGYRLFSGRLPGTDERVEVLIAMLELAIVVFLTTSYLVAIRFGQGNAPAQPTRDAVTGCLDRASIDRRLAWEFDKHDHRDALTVLMIDLDHLKAINDAHGHPAGDEALRAVAAAMLGQIRTSDAVGRYGGDEFLVILPGTSAMEADRVVDRMRAALARHESVCGPVTISVGVAERHARDHTETLIARADAALYAAKREGRNRVVTIGNTPSPT